jgi:hypothetical protein
MSSKSSLSGAIKNSILAILTVVIIHILLKQYFEPFESPQNHSIYDNAPSNDNILDYVYATNTPVSNETVTKQEDDKNTALPQDMSIEQYLNSFATPPPNTQDMKSTPTTTLSTSTTSKKSSDLSAFGGFDTSSSPMYSWWNN